MPLNENGIRQAEQAGRWFRQHDIRFARAYASPLIRAVETARLAGGSDIITDERLIEMDYGPYEGMSLKNPDSEIRRFFSDFVHQPAPEGMESLSDVTARLGVFLEDFNTRNCHERRVGIPDTRFGRQLLVEVYRQLRGLLRRSDSGRIYRTGAGSHRRIRRSCILLLFKNTVNNKTLHV